MEERKHDPQDSDLLVCSECGTPKKDLLSMRRLIRALISSVLISISSSSDVGCINLCPKCGSDISKKKPTGVPIYRIVLCVIILILIIFGTVFS